MFWLYFDKCIFIDLPFHDLCIITLSEKICLKAKHCITLYLIEMSFNAFASTADPDPQHMFWMRNKKIIFLLHTLNLSPEL